MNTLLLVRMLRHGDGGFPCAQVKKSASVCVYVWVGDLRLADFPSL